MRVKIVAYRVTTGSQFFGTGSLPGHIVAGSPGHRVTKATGSPGHRVTKPTGSPGQLSDRVTGSLHSDPVSSLPCATTGLMVVDVTKVKKSKKIDNYFRFFVKVLA